MYVASFSDDLFLYQANSNEWKFQKVYQIPYPIDVTENKGNYVILDGLHRLVKCKLLGMNYVMVRIIPKSEIENISKKETKSQ